MTDVGTLTLSDFLLARIAEDEAVARRVDGVDFAELLPAAQVFGMRGLMMPAARVLAECEAKRRIVDSWVAAGHAAGAYPGTLAGVEQGLDVALQFLALPYADHPDYREEWRV